MDPTMLVAIVAFVLVAGVGLALSGGGGDRAAAQRAKSISGRKPTKRSEVDTAALKRKQTTQDALKELSQNEKQSRKRRISIKGQLEQSGLTISMTAFWIASGVLGAILGLAGFIMQGSVLGLIGGLFVGAFGLPRWILKFLIDARQKKFTNQLADAIDVIVRGVKSGLPLNQCMRIIAQESPEPLRTEFQNIVDGQAMGVPLDQNLNRFYERMPLPEVNFFAIVLIIQQRTGGNLSESLGNLSGVLRARKMMKEKVKALSSEAKASAMIIGSLPFIVMLMVYFTRPEYISLLFTRQEGNLILLGAGVMMGSGILVMRNMVNFKF
ncbi:MAG: type II secretion system F family protein [Hyphomonadaceae bacterium]|nr:type II secretion system F family protein [Hyphomonadaceae bacterium]